MMYSMVSQNVSDILNSQATFTYTNYIEQKNSSDRSSGVILAAKLKTWKDWFPLLPEWPMYLASSVRGCPSASPCPGVNMNQSLEKTETYNKSHQSKSPSSIKLFVQTLWQNSGCCIEDSTTWFLNYLSLRLAPVRFGDFPQALGVTNPNFLYVHEARRSAPPLHDCSEMHHCNTTFSSSNFAFSN